jgi:hypothetical protein
MRKYGVQLDSMEPHWVSIKKSRTVLVRWAKQAQQPNIKRMGNLIEKGVVKQYGVYVKPHPFINKGLNVAIPKLHSYIKENVRISR